MDVNANRTYAQLSETGICVGVSSLAPPHPVPGPLVDIDDLPNPNTVIGMLYEDGEWKPDPNPPIPPEPELTSYDMILAILEGYINGKD